MVLLEINNNLHAKFLGLVPLQHCIFAITEPGNSTLTDIDLFRFV